MESFFIDEMEPGTESISYQDLSFKRKLVDKYTELMNVSASLDGPMYFKDRTSIGLIEDIEDMIYARVGIRVRHFHSNHMYACIPATIKLNSNLTKTYVDVYNNITNTDI